MRLLPISAEVFSVDDRKGLLLALEIQVEIPSVHTMHESTICWILAHQRKEALYAPLVSLRHASQRILGDSRG